MTTLRLALGVGALLICAPLTITAQNPPAALTGITRVDVAQRFRAVEQYNEHVRSATAASRNAAHGQVNLIFKTLLGAALLGAAYNFYRENAATDDMSEEEKKSASGKQSGAGLVGAGVLGVLLADLPDQFGKIQRARATERQSLDSARRLFPRFDPAR